MLEPTTRCPNCSSLVLNHPQNGCVLTAFIELLRDRENKSEQELLELHANANVDALWADLGPILDALEDGKYS